MKTYITGTVNTSSGSLDKKYAKAYHEIFPKKKSYWIEVVKWDTDQWEIYLCGRNNFSLSGHFYRNKREVNQQAKRLAKALGLEVRK